MKVTVFWYVTPCSLVEVYKRFRVCLLALLFDPDNGGSTFLRKISKFYQTTRRHITEDSTTPQSKEYWSLKAYRILVGKPEGNRPLEIPTRRWEDIIKTDLGEIGWGGVDGTDLSHVRDQ
jgi:hypothetical protein